MPQSKLRERILTPMADLSHLLTMPKEQLLAFVSSYTHCKAYWHPLGFVSCTLLSTASATAKIHYWPLERRKPKIPDWRIHDHRFQIDSRVLWGEVGHHIYRVADCHDSEYELYQVAYAGKDSTLEPTGRHVRAEKTSEQNFSVGSIYCIPRPIYHANVVSISSTAATLVVKSDFSTNPPLVVGLPNTEIVPYVREEFENALFWDAIFSGLRSCPDC